MKKLSIPSLFIILLFFCPTGLYSQNSVNNQLPDTLVKGELAEVIITATRYPEQQLNVPEAVRLLDANTMSRYQVRTAPESLIKTPGVFVQKTNHGGGSPFLRGLTGNQTLLLIDGIRISNAASRYGPNQTFNTIDVFGIRRTEVLRGNGSVQYGSDAMGGAIQAFTWQPEFLQKQKWGGSLASRIATHGMEQSLHSVIDYSGRRSAFRASVTARNFGDIVGGDTTGRQIPTGYGELDYDLKAKFLLAELSELTIAYQNVHQTDVPVYHKYVLENYAMNRMDPQDRELGYLRLNQGFKGNILKSAVFTLFMQNSDETREMRKNGSSVVRTERDRVRTYGMSAEAVTSLSGLWKANSGIELYQDMVSSSRTETDFLTGNSVSGRGLYPDGSSMASLAAYSLHSFIFGKWGVNAGGRLNSYIISVKDEAIGTAKLKPTALVGSLSLLRKINAETNLFASVNSGFRAPNIDDLGTLGIVDFRYETPNYDLKPEHSLQFQIGMKHSGDNLSGEIYLYRNHLSDLIVRNILDGDTIDGYPVYIKENVEQAYIQGFETAWDVRFNRSLELNLSYTYTYGHNITNNEPVRRIPPMFWRVAPEYASGIWWINLEWLGASEQNRLAAGDVSDNRIPAGGTPGWNIFNLNSGIDSGWYSVDLSLCNLLNEDYRYHGSGLNGTGRSLFITFIVRLGNLRNNPV